MKGVLMNSVVGNYNVKSSYSQLAFKATQPGASRIDKAIKAAVKLDNNAINKIKEAFGGGGPYVTIHSKKAEKCAIKDMFRFLKKFYKNNLLKNSGKV